MRSVSRLSVSDPGANARRVIAYMSELRTQIEYRESLSQPSS
jgi:hypothetical protein